MQWTSDELDTIAATDDLQISSKRSDGTFRPYVPLWVVRVGDSIYVRSYKGRESGWYRHAAAAGAGRIRSGGIERDAVFTDSGLVDGLAIDEGYRSKYARFGYALIDPMIAAAARGAAFRIDPA